MNSEMQKEEQNTKIEFLSHIRKIGEITKQSGGLNELFYEFADAHLEFLSKYISINKPTAAIFAAMVNMFTGQEITINHLANYLKVECIDIIMLMDEIEILEQKELIQISHENSDPFSCSNECIFFKVPLRTIEALRKGSCQALLNKKNLTIDDLFTEIEHLYEERVQRRMSFGNTKKRMKNMLQDNTHLDFVKKVLDINLPDDDMLVLMRFFHYTVNVDEPDMTFRHLEALYEHSSHFTGVKRLFKNGQHILIIKNLIENSFGDGFCDSDSYRLTASAKEEFLGDISELLSETPVKGLKHFDSISEKKLFYPLKTKRSIEELTSLLQQENFPAIQKRLSEKGMRVGFACLFSGGPGTGKTETAYQIARMCGRDIMQIDIANTKSKWFGDSEKMIKSLFDKYRTAVKRQAITPILLFNEADAVFSKRRHLEDDYSGPAQTENAIQNIILQEIENLVGILIATTNLSSNMDAAFERRFLYKIDFEKPEITTRKEIWLSMITDLNEEDAHILALRYDFSGGQIENIARKISVHHVLSGITPSLEEMIRFCNEEVIHKDGGRQIGFLAS
ncbi:MAG: ATP-binding protein [Treponema sp.]|nr:ATP-binding protein [Treponema sp.]MCL2251285.1 ATP-binding protein [Treponema sp.]